MCAYVRVCVHTHTHIYIYTHTYSYTRLLQFCVCVFLFIFLLGLIKPRLMKIIELSAVYAMNFRICCELAPIVDYKKQYMKYILSKRN